MIHKKQCLGVFNVDYSQNVLHDYIAMVRADIDKKFGKTRQATQYKNNMMIQIECLNGKYTFITWPLPKKVSDNLNFGYFNEKCSTVEFVKVHSETCFYEGCGYRMPMSNEGLDTVYDIFGGIVAREIPGVNTCDLNERGHLTLFLVNGFRHYVLDLMPDMESQFLINYWLSGGQQ